MFSRTRNLAAWAAYRLGPNLFRPTTKAELKSLTHRSRMKTGKYSLSESTHLKQNHAQNLQMFLLDVEQCVDKRLEERVFL